MALLKKEWRTILTIFWLVLITLFLWSNNNQLRKMNVLNARIASTLDTVESVVISSDAGVGQLSKRVGEIEGNVSYIVERIRRR